MTVHLLAGSVCLAAATVMWWRASLGRVRAAHLVVVATMAALLVGMHSVTVILTCAALLAGTSACLVTGRDRGARSCAVDVAAMSCLVALMGLPLLLTAPGQGGPTAAGETGMHARMHAAVPGNDDHALMAVGVALALVAAWGVLRRADRSAGSSRLAGAAAWTMMLSMGAMIAS